MSNHGIQFYSFVETVALARKEADTDFVGLKFTPPFDHLGIYVINTLSDVDDQVNIQYSGGLLFSSSGEEDFYDIEDVPAEAKRLFYARRSQLGEKDVQFMDMTSEFVLQEVLPKLDADAKYRDHKHFMQTAGTAFASFWRHS